MLERMAVPSQVTQGRSGRERLGEVDTRANVVLILSQVEHCLLGEALSLVLFLNHSVE